MRSITIESIIFADLESASDFLERIANLYVSTLIISIYSIYIDLTRVVFVGIVWVT